MNDENERLEDLQPAAEDRTKELSGQLLWRVLKPAGCIFVLVLFILFLVMCFTAKGTMPPVDPTPAAVTEPAQP